MKLMNKNRIRSSIICLLLCMVSTSVFGITIKDYGELPLGGYLEKSYQFSSIHPHEMGYAYFSLSENARIDFSYPYVPGLARRVSVWERYGKRRSFGTYYDPSILKGTICLPPGDYEFHIDCVYTSSEKSYSFLFALKASNLKPGDILKEPLDSGDWEKEPSYGQDPMPGITTSRSYLREKQMLSEDGLNSIEKVSYFDGIGRPVQTVYSGFTPSKDDFVDFTDYNSRGLVWRQWLPIPVSSTNSAFVNNLPAKSASIIGDKVAFSKKRYELMSINRLSHISGAGEEFKYKTVDVEYGYNNNEELRCLDYRVSGDKIIQQGFCAQGTLEVERRKDEDYHISYIFKDRMGRVILERLMDRSESYDTYYVYNPGGDLSYVLPPAIDGDLSTTSLDRYAYRYRYDGLHRLIEKKLPGKDPILYTYDNADRLIFQQDGNLREKGQCLFVLPDAMGREVISGICRNDFSSSIDTLVNTAFDVNGGNLRSGYSFNHISSPQLMTIKYYDTYDYLELSAIRSHADSLRYVSLDGYGIRYERSSSPIISAYGKLTGMRVFSPDTGDEIITSYYYDDKGNVVQQHSTNHLGGYDRNYFAYTFTGKVLRKMHSHSVPEKQLLSEYYFYTYDHAERLISVNHHIGNNPSVVLSKNEYDSFCRLGSEFIHNGLVKTDYSYNIRGWLTGIHSNLFTQTLHYTDGHGYPCYTGNISSMEWKSASDALMRGYCFTYDDISRLENASYGEGNRLNENRDRYNEMISYDKMGNILELVRSGQISSTKYGQIDYLKMKYDGNQLQSVSDQATDSVFGKGFEFKDGSDLDIEYFYDANGNLTKDLNKKIAEIAYNYLNLPSKIRFENGDSISYVYSGDGTKLRTRHIINGLVNTTDYCGNAIYENGVAKLLLTERGYITLSDTVYHYFLQDHQGNNRVIVDQNGTVEEENHYYPFGGVFAHDGDVQPYKYNGKELDRKNGLDWYDYGARMYDAALCRWHSMDPLAEKYYNWSSYAYCLGNPIMYVDPNGTFTSPYYTTNGQFLGVDEYGFTGNIYITDKEVFDKNSRNGIANSKNIQGDKNTILMKDKLLTSAAESHIYTDVLKKSADTRLDMSQLYNGEVSIVENVVRKGDEFIGKGYNNPDGHRYAPKYNQSYVNGKIRVTVEQGSNQHDLYMVESIQNYLGVHEYYGHGIMNWSTRKTHWKCYNAQLHHPTFQKLPKYQQNEIRQRNREFYINRNN